MKNYLKHHPWQVIEEGFHPAYHQVSESIYSLGNGRFGVRGNFEEDYSGEMLPGSYFAGIYYPDKTRVGWWKNGYPEYFAKVLNAVNWIGVRILINDNPLDLFLTPPEKFTRVLDMESGILVRAFEIRFSQDAVLGFRIERFCSMADPDTAAVRIQITSFGFEGRITLEPYLNFDVHNKDANYGDQFWTHLAEGCVDDICHVAAVTKKTHFTVTSLMSNLVKKNDQRTHTTGSNVESMKVSQRSVNTITGGDTITLDKYVVNLSSLYHDPSTHMETGFAKMAALKNEGYDVMRSLHAGAWQTIWDNADILIGGDVAAQQGIRFNIFHLWQTYTGEDPRLNIGPKGFTGEKYGGSTYWDTEAYCIPFYLSTADPHVARNLLMYRYLHLPKAIENAAKLGFTNGAALYPMVTINGEECHNEWEITFEEIHRNGAMVYAIYDYIKYTGDSDYLTEAGLEVLIGVARFWAQRVNYSDDKKAWVMLGVTGPNEYENNVNNNWYTNYIARWCLYYALEQIENIKNTDSSSWMRIRDKVVFKNDEPERWKEIADGMYFPYDTERDLFLQQDGFLDKELITVSELPERDRPINQKWSWDRILRSCFIKQADVLQGMYFFEDHFERSVIGRHFDFYESMTVHESSLSPCVHAILAAHLGKTDKAVAMYLRTARLDLDDYNNDTEDGLHITSMAGTWMSIVRGFAGMSVKNDMLHLDPVMPPGWDLLRFKMRFRGRICLVEIKNGQVDVVRLSGDPLEIIVRQQPLSL